MPDVRHKLSIAVALTGMAVFGVGVALAENRAPATVSATAVSDAEHAQVAAATANAFLTLRGDVEQSSITPGLRVIDFLQRTDGQDAFNKALHRAEQIGGPRWLDDQTCQVRLEISGERIARALVDIA